MDGRHYKTYFGQYISPSPHSSTNAYTLTDISSDIAEFAIKFKNSRRELVAVDVNGKENNIDFTHRFFRVTLKYSDEVYALDLSGAQYRYYDPVTPFETYLEERARATVAPEQQYFGRTRDALMERFSETGQHWIGNSPESFGSPIPET